MHLGDFNDPDKTGCNQQSYSVYSDLLKNSPIPTFVTIGEDDWPDCPNSVSGLIYWNEYFGQIEDRWATRMGHYTVERSTDRISNFAFLHRRVLYIGISFYTVKSGEADSVESRRLFDNLTWVQKQFLQHVDEFDMAVLFANEAPDYDQNNNDDDPEYTARLFPSLIETVFQYFEIPILFVHESSRGKSKLQSGQFGTDYIWDLEIQGELFPFMRVTVDTDNYKSPFSFLQVTDDSQNNKDNDKNKNDKNK